jgi:pre-mRNA-splicing factor 38A
MANVTDPLALIRGSDPQNLMEYIVRQKIYDSRFWKEECFGLSTADVLEKAATSLQCIGGTFGGNRRPTKFLCLTLKLLQLQPDLPLIEQFIQQDHFKYVKALGAFYLRLIGRPHEIYELLEPLYNNYNKLKYRDVTEWKLVHMDEFIDQIFTQPIVCGIALPRLPARSTLVEAGYLVSMEEDEEEGDRNDMSHEELYRPTSLKEAILVAGGFEAYLKYKVEVERSPPAIALWQQRFPNNSSQLNDQAATSKMNNDKDCDEDGVIDEEGIIGGEHNEKGKKHKKHKEDGKKKKRKYGTLFKDDAIADGSDEDQKATSREKKIKSSNSNNNANVEEGSEEFWNIEREKLGLKPLRK